MADLKKQEPVETPPCPCCGKERLELGLFYKQATCDEPVVFTIMNGHDEDHDIEYLTPYLARSFNRHFLKTICPLPLGRINSPITPQVWVEITEQEVNKILHLDSFPQAEKDNKSIQGLGRLANDLPGFYGSLGSYSTYYKQQGKPAVIFSCEDERVKEIPVDLDHQGMVELYRSVWGNPDMVAEANLEQRAKINAYWKKLIETPTYRQQVIPPPAISGIKPAEILIAPPQDTHDEVFLATIGCSETYDEDSRVEIIAFARNPSKEFIKSFSEFSYLSRISQDPIESGIMIKERESVPDSDNKMLGWLLWPPSWRYSQEQLNFPDHNGGIIQVLEAIPLHGFEILFAETFGIEKLIEYLQEDEVDLADLKRPPAVPLPDELDGEDL